MGRFLGKVCEKHPELNGARFESSRKCVRCAMDRNNALRKKPEQLARMREDVKKRETKGGPGYEAKKARNRKWYAENAEWFKARNQARKGLGGIWPQYVNELRDFYKNRPEDHHVDHIVPLKGIDPETKEHVVCGLHVPWNLQYLPGADNDSKWAWW